MLCIFIIKPDVFGQTIFSNNEKYGIMDDDSKKVTIPAEYDTIIAGSSSDSYGEIKSAHSFILRKDNKYYFALKEWKSTSVWKENADSGRTFPPLEGEDSVEWNFLNQEFDTLYRLKLDVFQYRKDATIQDFETYSGDTCFKVSKGIRHIVFRKDGKYGLLTFDKASRTFGSYVVGRIRYKRIEYSIDNIQIHPALYDHIFNIDKQLIGFKVDNKYGFINLSEGYEIAPEFDDVLVPLKYERYYYAKKNGLWGVIYLNKYSSDYIVSIPFRYTTPDDIGRNLQYVDFYEQRTFKEGEGLGTQLQNKYTACLYQSGKDVPFQLEFIIYDGETFSPTVRNVETNKQELNKEYIPQTERHVTFTPLINNAPVVQQERSEFICIHKEKQHVDDMSSLFFILKRDRLWDRNDNHYTNEKIEANAIYIYRYDFSKDSFVSVYGFAEESPQIKYQIISELLTTDEWKKTPNHYNIDLMLKSTILENEEYKYEFFTFEGKKVYELNSKYSIDGWEFVQEYNSNNLYHMTDNIFVLKFYTEILGKKKTKKKTVCHYNVKTKQFYK